MTVLSFTTKVTKPEKHNKVKFQKITSLLLLTLLLFACNPGEKIDSVTLKEDKVIIGYVERLQKANNGNFLMINEETQLIEMNPKTGELKKHFEVTDSVIQAVWNRVVQEYDYLDFLKPDDKGYTNSFWITGHWEENEHKYVSCSFDFVYNGMLDTLKAQFSFGFSALFDITPQGTELYTFGGEEWPIQNAVGMNQESILGPKMGILDYGFMVQNGKALVKQPKHAKFLVELDIKEGLPSTGELSLAKKNAWPSEDGLPAQFKKIGKEMFVSDGFQVLSLERDFVYHLEKRNPDQYFLDFHIDKDFANFMYFVPDTKKYKIVRTNLKGSEPKEYLTIDDFGMAFCLEKDRLYYIEKDEESCYFKTLHLK